MKTRILLTAIFVLPVLVFADPERTATTATNTSVISVEFRHKWDMKPPLRCFYVQLTVSNTHDQPTWYITRYYGDQPLGTNALFKAGSPWNHEELSVKACNGAGFGGQGQFRTVSFHGDNWCDMFIAFLLPAKGHLQDDYFPIEADADITTCEIWEASSLKVNDHVALEDWLPDVVISSKETHITKDASQDWHGAGAYQWKEGKSKDDYPKEMVKSIVPTVIAKHLLPLIGVPSH